MEDDFSYLKDPRVLAEIRKHKWIESQKKGKEVGFATAAVDWINRYGQQWKKIHIKNYQNKSSQFVERLGTSP